MMGIYDLDLQELPLFEGLKADEVEQFILRQLEPTIAMARHQGIPVNLSVVDTLWKKLLRKVISSNSRFTGAWISLPNMNATWLKNTSKRRLW